MKTKEELELLCEELKEIGRYLIKKIVKNEDIPLNMLRMNEDKLLSSEVHYGFFGRKSKSVETLGNMKSKIERNSGGNICSELSEACFNLLKNEMNNPLSAKNDQNDKSFFRPEAIDKIEFKAYLCYFVLRQFDRDFDHAFILLASNTPDDLESKKENDFVLQKDFSPANTVVVDPWLRCVFSLKDAFIYWEELITYPLFLDETPRNYQYSSFQKKRLTEVYSQLKVTVYDELYFKPQPKMGATI